MTVAARTVTGTSRYTPPKPPTAVLNGSQITASRIRAPACHKSGAGHGPWRERELPPRDRHHGTPDLDRLEPSLTPLRAGIQQRRPPDLRALLDLDPLAEGDPAVTGEMDRQRAGRRAGRGVLGDARARARTCASSSAPRKPRSSSRSARPARSGRPGRGAGRRPPPPRPARRARDGARSRSTRPGAASPPRRAPRAALGRRRNRSTTGSAGSTVPLSTSRPRPARRGRRPPPCRSAG